MNECSNSSLWRRTGCILSYGGSEIDIVLNYVLLLVNVASCGLTLAWEGGRGYRVALHSLLFVMVFQIALCLALGCSGISIVWCACAGWIMAERRRLEDRSEGNPSAERLKILYVERAIIFLDVGAILYYAVVTAPITTVAHFCAMVLGAMLSMMTAPQVDVAREPLIVAVDED